MSGAGYHMVDGEIVHVQGGAALAGRRLLALQAAGRNAALLLRAAAGDVSVITRSERSDSREAQSEDWIVLAATLLGTMTEEVSFRQS